MVLFELLTGRPPHEIRELPLHLAVRAICEEKPPRPSACAGGMDRDLDTIVLKALEREPDDRYGGADALAEDLRRYLADLPIHARSGAAHRRDLGASCGGELLQSGAAAARPAARR